MVDKPKSEEAVLDFGTKQKKSFRKYYLFSSLIFIVSLFATFIGWYYTHNEIEERRTTEFEIETRRIANLIDKYEMSYSTILEGGKGLFSASKSVERDEFNAYVESLDLPQKYPGIVTVRYVERILDNQKENFIQEVRADTSLVAEGYPDFLIRSSDDFKSVKLSKPEYFVIKYEEPRVLKQNMLGFDVSTEPVRWQAYERSWMEGEVIFSGAVSIDKNETGFIATIPIFKNGVPHSNFEEKLTALQGFVNIVADSEIFFNTFFGQDQVNKGIELRVYDGDFSVDNLPVEKQIFDSFGKEGALDFKPRYQHIEKLEIGGMIWTLHFFAASEFQIESMGVEAEAPLIILGGGILVSFLLWAVLYSLASSRFQAVLLARKMTEDLRENETKLVKAMSDLKKGNAELKSMQFQLIQAEKAASITELAAGAAHEVKNPLAIVLQGVGYLNQHLENKSTDSSAVLTEMEEAVKRADYIIKGLLNLSRSTQLVFLKENLNAVIGESLMLVKILLDRVHIKTLNQLDPNLPLLMLDKGKMVQVFINLLTNAIHLMPEGGSITIRTRTQSLLDADIQTHQDDKHLFIAGQTVVVTEIEDTGPGINQKIQAKIFDPFFTTRRTKGGTGLGLSVVRNIVEMHGGIVTLDNRKDGKGACAVIVLPASNRN